MSIDLRARIAEGLAALGLDAPAAAPARLATLLDELARWNRAYNLTAVRDPAEMVAVHVLDSLAVLPWLHGRRVLDVGTGAGFPGLPLAIVDATRDYVLLDGNGKKIRFVDHIRRRLGLDHVTALQARIENYSPAAGFDTVVGRAFAPAPRFAADCRHVLAPGGRLLMLKGRDVAAELAGLAPDWEYRTEPLDVPGLARRRHLVVLTPLETAR